MKVITKLIILTVLVIIGTIILAGSVVSQSYIFKLNETVNFRFRCYDNNTNGYCNSATQNIINVEYPNGSNALNNQSLTFNESFFNVSLPTEVLGIYTAIIHSPSRNGTQVEFTYEVTGTGNALSTGESIIYFGFLIALFLTFLLTLYGSMKIPFRNHRDENYNIVGINDMKYVKVFLMIMSYIILMFIFAIIRAILQNLLFKSEFHKIFAWLFWLMFSFFIPAFLVSFVFLVLVWLNDKKIHKALTRGVPFR